MKSILAEAGLLLLAGSVIALAANQLSPRGLNLARNYFPKGSTPAALTNATPSLPVSSAADIPAAIAARLRQKGLTALGHARVAQLHDEQRQGRAVVFVDARDESHYLAAHIPGAYLFDPYHQEKYLTTVLPPCLAATNIVVYCNGGECEDSELAAITLNQIGIPADHLAVYAGGITEWLTNGLPVETGDRHRDLPLPARP